MSRLHPIKIRNLLNKYSLSSDYLEIFNEIPLINYTEYFITSNVELMINTIYHSSNIEYEDELTIQNTEVIVNDIIHKGKRALDNRNKTHTDTLVRDMFDAYRLMEILLLNDYLVISDINDLHYELTKEISGIRTPGWFREFEATINGREDCVKFTSPHLIESELCELINNINEFLIDLTSGYPYSNEEKLDRILDIKRRFIKIHPFEDGNGRMSRLLFQYLLIKASLPMCSYKGWNRKDYHNGMHIAYITNGRMSIIKTMYINEILNN